MPVIPRKGIFHIFSPLLQALVILRAFLFFAPAFKLDFRQAVYTGIRTKKEGDIIV